MGHRRTARGVVNAESPGGTVPVPSQSTAYIFMHDAKPRKFLSRAYTGVYEVVKKHVYGLEQKNDQPSKHRENFV
jgi:hypothetical protein